VSRLSAPAWFASQSFCSGPRPSPEQVAVTNAWLSNHLSDRIANDARLSEGQRRALAKELAALEAA